MPPLRPDRPVRVSARLEAAAQSQGQQSPLDREGELDPAGPDFLQQLLPRYRPLAGAVEACSLKRAATNWCLDRDRHDDRGLYCVPCARRHHDFCVSKSRYLWRKRHKRSKTSPPNLYGPPWDDFWERMIPRPGLFHRVSCLYPCNRCECCRFCGGSSFNQRCNEKFVSEQTRAEEARKKRARKNFRAGRTRARWSSGND